MPCAHAFSPSLSYTQLWHTALNFSLSLAAFLLVFPPTYPRHPPFSYLFLSHTLSFSLVTHAHSLSLSLSRHSLIRCDTSTLLYIHSVSLLNKHSLPLLLSFTNRDEHLFFYVTKAIFVKEYQLVINCAHTERFSTRGMWPKMHHRSVSIWSQTATWCKMQKSRPKLNPLYQ